MNVKVLPSALTAILMLVIFSMGIMACNNSDKSENNSTTTSDTVTGNRMDTNYTATDTAGQTNTGRTVTNSKKRGRITVAQGVAKATTTAPMKADKQGYYNYTETAPSFTGGQTALEEYINNNIEYPDEAINYNVEGTVNVEFYIDENGKITNVSTTGKDLGYGLEAAAIKAVSSMPNWTPGKVNGKNVKTKHTLPITFKLEE